jgi:hypothetical protein
MCVIFNPVDESLRTSVSRRQYVLWRGECSKASVVSTKDEINYLIPKYASYHRSMGTRFPFIRKFSILYCRRPNVLAAQMPLVSSLREDERIGTERDNTL